MTESMENLVLEQLRLIRFGRIRSCCAAERAWPE